MVERRRDKSGWHKFGLPNTNLVTRPSRSLSGKKTGIHKIRFYSLDMTRNSKGFFLAHSERGLVGDRDVQIMLE